MALINRFTRLFTADLNAVLDRIEEPDVLLRQAVRDMEDEITAMQASHKALGSEAERLAALVETDRERLAELDDELDVCFRSGEEALARGLVRRKLETERRAKLNAARREAALKAHAELEATLAEDARTLEQMRQKLDVLTADPGRRGPPAPCTTDLSVGADEVDVAFLREKARRMPS